MPGQFIGIVLSFTTGFFYKKNSSI